MVSHGICIPYFLNRLEQFEKKYVSIYPINFIKALRALCKCCTLGILSSLLQSYRRGGLREKAVRGAGSGVASF